MIQSDYFYPSQWHKTKAAMGVGLRVFEKIKNMYFFLPCSSGIKSQFSRNKSSADFMISHWATHLCGRMYVCYRARIKDKTINYPPTVEQEIVSYGSIETF